MNENQDGTVYVFGAGIAGLTAAHELAERGFKVVVIEAETDYEDPEKCAVGGMARSQWSRIELPQRRPTGTIMNGRRTIPRAMPIVSIKDVIEIDPDSHELKDAEALDRVADVLIKNSHILCTLVVGCALPSEKNRRKLASSRANKVRDYLVAKGILEARLAVEPPEEPREGETDANVHSEGACVQLAIQEDRVPGEHGFRFFPAFYRHVFDTMKRTPVLALGDKDYANSTRSVLDNLIPTESTWLALEKGESFSFPRQRPGSIREIFDAFSDFMAKLHYSPQDIAQLSLKLFKYMTSCADRRRAIYEDISWWDFIEGEQLSERCRDHMDAAPEILGALVAKKSDARTQGSCTVQLLLDHLSDGKRTDATLNGPTSLAWFDPWRDYLKYQHVEFIQGTLTDFRCDGEHVYPVVVAADETNIKINYKENDYFIIAASLPAMVGEPGAGRPGLAKKFLEAAAKRSGAATSSPGDVGDFEKLVAMKVPDWNVAINEGPLQHLSGIQYFFRTDVGQEAGHILYLDSSWRLSAIAQPRFWLRPRAEFDGYRGILSVDIGNWYNPSQKIEPAGRSAWNSTRDEIAMDVWEQVRGTMVGETPRAIPEPVAYHLDYNIEFGVRPGAEKEAPVRNKSPYLINRPGEWRGRPGEPGAYSVQAERWALAGTYMKTYTRLTTMEAANESGRHAVNALLKKMDFAGEMCRVWDPEEHEHPDLKWWKELDKGLWDRECDPRPAHERKPPSVPLDEYMALAQHRRLPHFTDIVELRRAHESLLPSSLAGSDAVEKRR